MLTHSPRAFPWEIATPVGERQTTQKHGRSARGRRLRLRICLRKDCGRRYQPRPRCWNQRYCGDPECLRQVRRWQAARRQAKYRLAAHVKARHARAEKARRQRVNAASQTVANPEIAPRRGHAAQTFFPLSLCDRPGCYEEPTSSIRNRACYCGRDCRLAVRNVLDREHKWLSRGTPAGRKKRSFEYQAARQRRIARQACASNSLPLRAPPN